MMILAFHSNNYSVRNKVLPMFVDSNPPGEKACTQIVHLGISFI